MTLKLNILKNAGNLFAKKGIGAATMDELADRLGISKKTIYKHFCTKSHLVNNVYVEALAKFEKEMALVYENYTNALSEFTEMCYQILKFNKTFSAEIVRDIKVNNEECYKKYLIFKNRYIPALIISNLERGVNEKLYKQTLNYDITVQIIAQELLILSETNCPDISFKDLSLEYITHLRYIIQDNKI